RGGGRGPGRERSPHGHGRGARALPVLPRPGLPAHGRSPAAGRPAHAAGRNGAAGARPPRLSVHLVGGLPVEIEPEEALIPDERNALARISRQGVGRGERALPFHLRLVAEPPWTSAD